MVIWKINNVIIRCSSNRAQSASVVRKWWQDSFTLHAHTTKASTQTCCNRLLKKNSVHTCSADAMCKSSLCPSRAPSSCPRTMCCNHSVFSFIFRDLACVSPLYDTVNFNCVGLSALTPIQPPKGARELMGQNRRKPLLSIWAGVVTPWQHNACCP